MLHKNIKIQNKIDAPYERLSQGREKAIAGFIKGRDTNFHEHYSRLLDEYFIESFEMSTAGLKMMVRKNPFAIIALGGYGREEQCIHSDVDLLFLFNRRVPREAEELVREIIYPLWDIGLDVGYATRSIKESISLAQKELDILTSILDARFICGSSLLYLELMDRLHEKVTKKRARKIITGLSENCLQRHASFGDSSYLLEPNLKDGQGGLRDLHVMIWIARIRSNLRKFRDLEYHGYISNNEYQILNVALQFIKNTRNYLHYLNNRKCDQLHFEHQIKIASSMNFKMKNGQQPVEIFLSELHGHMEFIKQLHLMFLYELGCLNNPKRGARSNKGTVVDGLYVTEKGMLNYVSPERIIENKNLLIRIFEESARLSMPLNSEAKRLTREFLHFVNRDYYTTRPNIVSFEKILTAHSPMFNVLNEMLNTGFLTRFIPEFGSISDRIQYDEYHLYPVDKHSLKTLQEIKKFGTQEGLEKDPLSGKLFRELKNKKLLLWAAFLHDIGKGTGAKNHSKHGAEIVRTILEKRDYGKNEIETVCFLVEEHLLLIKTATRRDISNEETIIAVARRIKKISLLKMLYLLTIGDAMATGPKAWNDWIAALLRDLFFSVLSILENGELATGEAVRLVEKKRSEIIDSATDAQSEKELQTLFNMMSPRYIHYTPSKDILGHIALFKSMGKNLFAWDITKAIGSNTRTVTICAKDQPGLISRIAGTFTLNNLDILNVQAFTWRNNIALDIFELRPPRDILFEDEKWLVIEKQLHSALSGELDLGKALKEKMRIYMSVENCIKNAPHKVEVDNKSSKFFSIVEIFSYDFPGLLYGITNILFNHGLDVWVAKIATKIDQVVDVFYVRDFDGQKIDSPDRVESLKRSIDDFLSQFSNQS